MHWDHAARLQEIDEGGRLGGDRVRPVDRQEQEVDSSGEERLESLSLRRLVDGLDFTLAVAGEQDSQTFESDQEARVVARCVLGGLDRLEDDSIDADLLVQVRSIDDRGAGKLVATVVIVVVMRIEDDVGVEIAEVVNRTAEPEGVRLAVIGENRDAVREAQDERRMAEIVNSKQRLF